MGSGVGMGWWWRRTHEDRVVGLSPTFERGHTCPCELGGSWVVGGGEVGHTKIASLDCLRRLKGDILVHVS